MATHRSSSRDLRVSQRYPARFAVELIRGFRRVPAAIKDLSSGGALLEADTDLKVGSLISLAAHELQVNARVVRATGHEYGVQFTAPIDPLEVIRQNVAGLEHLRGSRSRNLTSVTAH